MSEENEKYFKFPAFNNYIDTGFVEHSFSDGTSIRTEVVETDDDGGFAIHLTMHDGEDHEFCDLTLDRFASLCVVDALIKTLLLQDEANFNLRQELLERSKDQWKNLSKE